MTLRLVDSQWEFELVNALRSDRSALRIVCPFIKLSALSRLLSIQPESIQVVTRFNLHDFADGVSDIDALRHVLQARGKARGIRNLHAKLYLFGSSRAIVTSANLTVSGLRQNSEFGVITDDPAAVASCLDYFNGLWQLAGKDLESHQLDEWDRRLNRYLSAGARPGAPPDLGDFGVDAEIAPALGRWTSPIFIDPPQAFVKFLGEGRNRLSPSCPTIHEIDGAGCHWALAYPAGGDRRPTGVKDGAVMFISRLVKGPDIRVFGRAIALKHEAGRDDATQSDIHRRPWKSRWPRYIRIHHAEFIAGTMEDGVSLGELMDALGSNSFASTKRNAARGDGNINPRRAFTQQPAVELSEEGFRWLNDRLEAAFDAHGRVPDHVLRGLDWPEPPVRSARVPEFTKEEFNRELRRMLDKDARTGRTSSGVVARDLHRNVVGGADPNRMPMACRAMWKLWKQQGSIPENVIHRTTSGESSTVEIEFLLSLHAPMHAVDGSAE